MTGSDHQPACGSKSRRKFLQVSGAAAASVLAGVDIPPCHAAGNGTIKLALVGCGNRGTGAVANAFSATGGPVKLYAMADLFDDRLQGSFSNLQKAFPAQIDVPPERRFLGFDAYRKAIDCLGPGDVVLLTTYAAFRPLHFEYAVAKGVNVFMEKSFAVDAPALRRLLKAAETSEKKNLKVAAGFMWRHSQAREEVIRRIHDGMIGDLHTLRIYRVQTPVHCSRRASGDNELVFQLRRPLSFLWLSGGFHVDWHCHNVDVACWAKDAWPVAAQGFGGRCYPEAGNLFDHYSIEYTFPDGAKLFAFSRHMNGCWQEYADYAHGAKGSAVIMTNLAAPSPRVYKSQKMTKENLVWEYRGSDPNPYEVEWQLLLDAIRQNKPHNESRRAAQADLTALMGRMATRSGAYVTWDEALNSNFQYAHDIDGMTMDMPAPLHSNADGTYSTAQPGLAKEY